MSEFIWLVEHREYCNGEMVCTITHAATTLKIAEYLMRNHLGAPETRGYYSIFPLVINESGLGTPNTDVMRNKGNFVLNFYYLQGNQLEWQPTKENGICPSYGGNR